MYRQHLLKNLEREIELLRQIIPLIEERDLEFRPGEKVRSTYELMQYLSSVGSVMMRWFIKNDLTPEEWQKIRDYRQTLTLTNFSDRLDEQWHEIKGYMDLITDEDLNSKVVELPSKEKMALGAAIINCPIKWLASYRMHLFVYLKINGHTEIGTKEAWTMMQPV